MCNRQNENKKKKGKNQKNNEFDSCKKNITVLFTSVNYIISVVFKFFVRST